MVNQYMNHTLSIEEMEEFLDHIQSCSSCYDELETYFIVHEAMRQLAEDEGDTVLDFRKLLNQDIKKGETQNSHMKIERFFAGIAVLLLIALFTGLLLFIIKEVGGHL